MLAKLRQIFLSLALYILFNYRMQLFELTAAYLICSYYWFLRDINKF